MRIVFWTVLDYRLVVVSVLFYGYSAEGEFDAVVVVEVNVACNGCFKLVGTCPFVSVIHFVFHSPEEAFTCSIIG